MVHESIDRDLVNEYERTSAALIRCIREALDHFFRNPPEDWESWEEWRTPIPWRDYALPNLERYHADLITAREAYDRGDFRAIVYDAAGYAGISKDLDFDNRWMTEVDRREFQKAIKAVVIVARKIHQLGYEQFKG
ncbi:hypothetical protein [uncultured Thiodictyon sp.]|uniref:hypothetical protein n=1 Tax=uncultured Thiodictyon sp. TaxID=1846217 RepID=UPI0025EB9C31|nr:hypothetical protein [uncultured Thiodictyon sp.]